MIGKFELRSPPGLTEEDKPKEPVEYVHISGYDGTNSVSRIATDEDRSRFSQAYEEFHKEHPDAKRAEKRKPPAGPPPAMPATDYQREANALELHMRSDLKQLGTQTQGTGLYGRNASPQPSPEAPAGTEGTTGGEAPPPDFMPGFTEATADGSTTENESEETRRSKKRRL